MTAIQDFQYRPDRAFISEGLGRYRNTTAVVSALALASTFSAIHLTMDGPGSINCRAECSRFVLQARVRWKLYKESRSTTHWPTDNRTCSKRSDQNTRRLPATYCI